MQPKSVDEPICLGFNRGFYAAKEKQSHPRRSSRIVHEYPLDQPEKAWFDAKNSRV
jgi:hypothetical protein